MNHIIVKKSFVTSLPICFSLTAGSSYIVFIFLVVMRLLLPIVVLLCILWTIQISFNSKNFVLHMRLCVKHTCHLCFLSYFY